MTLQQDREMLLISGTPETGYDVVGTTIQGITGKAPRLREVVNSATNDLIDRGKSAEVAVTVDGHPKVTHCKISIGTHEERQAVPA